MASKIPEAVGKAHRRLKDMYSYTTEVCYNHDRPITFQYVTGSLHECPLCQAAVELSSLAAKLAAAEKVVQAVKDLRTSDQLGPVEPPNNTHFYILTVKSHEKLLEMISAYDQQAKEQK